MHFAGNISLLSGIKITKVLLQIVLYILYIVNCLGEHEFHLLQAYGHHCYPGEDGKQHHESAEQHGGIAQSLQSYSWSADTQCGPVVCHMCDILQESCKDFFLSYNSLTSYLTNYDPKIREKIKDLRPVL